MIITEPKHFVSEVHDRMPVILARTFATFSATVLPFMVSASPWIRPASSNSCITAGSPTGPVIFLAEIFPGRLHVDEERHVVAKLLPVLDRKLDADVPRDGDEMTGDWSSPIAEQATIAFSTAARVKISDGFKSSRTISTARTPVS